MTEALQQQQQQQVPQVFSQPAGAAAGDMSMGTNSSSGGVCVTAEK
jgi:hypothetical protein